MSKLNEFKDMVSSVDDTQLLESGLYLLRDLTEIDTLKKKIKDLEDGLTEGGRAALYFFASELDSEELLYATENLNGRIKFLNKKMEK
tara:strand:+ start:3356 stop:3619 length:264 start_codon:yes stop_codon:yes gene_type:complete